MHVILKTLVLGAAVSAVGVATAQETAQTPVQATRAAGFGPNETSLPANTEVAVTLNAEVNSKRVKQGQNFDVSVARDVTLGNFVVIPRGTKGVGQVTYRTGKGAFGKSAKMEIEIRSLNLGGRTIPISGKFRQEGSGNTGATVATAVAVGVFSAFVTGKSAVFEQGRELKCFTVEALPVTLPAS